MSPNVLTNVWTRFTIVRDSGGSREAIAAMGVQNPRRRVSQGRTFRGSSQRPRLSVTRRAAFWILSGRTGTRNIQG